MQQAPYKITTNGKQNGHQPPPATVPLQPHNIEAEESVLGALLIDPDAILKVATFLDPADFFIERHGWIYQAVNHLFDNRQPCDLVTLTDELRRRGRLQDIGGEPFLSGLINATPTSIHVEYYARIVERTAILRRVIDGAGEITRLAYLDTQDAAEVVDQAQAIMFDIAGKKDSTTKPIMESTDSFLSRVEYLRQHRNQLVGLPTGLKDLDTLLGGLQKTDLIILAGRPGMGKTSLALSIALQAARKWQQRIAIFSLEMSDEQLVQRLVSAESGIDSQRIRLGDIKENEWPGFLQATTAIAETDIYINDAPTISALELRAEARKLHARHGLDLLIVDYLQLMRGDKKSGNREQEISYISRSLKILARELKIPVLALSQLNRNLESRPDKRPMLSDLRDSGSIEQDADAVVFVYRDEVYNPDTEYPNIAELILSKHRNGPTGSFEVYFKKHLAQFVDLVIRTHNLNNNEFEPMAK